MANSGDNILEMMEARKAELENELKKINAAIEAYRSASSQADTAPSLKIRRIRFKPKRTPWTKLVKEVFETHDELTTAELIEILKNEKGVYSLDDDEIAKNSLGTTIFRLRKSGFLQKDEDSGIISLKEKKDGQGADVETTTQIGDQSKLEL